jgi:cbb3-type cytochrome oxidase cytochrome c subunit
MQHLLLQLFPQQMASRAAEVAQQQLPAGAGAEAERSKEWHRQQLAELQAAVAEASVAASRKWNSGTKWEQMQQIADVLLTKADVAYTTWV